MTTGRASASSSSSVSSMTAVSTTHAQITPPITNNGVARVHGRISETWMMLPAMVAVAFLAQ
jgi:hypothetical protein